MPHTPGPWHLTPDYAGRSALVIQAANGEAIAQLFDEHIDAVANGRLLVNAPALLDLAHDLIELRLEEYAPRLVRRAQAIIDAIEAV